MVQENKRSTPVSVFFYRFTTRVPAAMQGETAISCNTLWACQPGNIISAILLVNFEVKIEERVVPGILLANIQLSQIDFKLQYILYVLEAPLTSCLQCFL